MPLLMYRLTGCLRTCLNILSDICLNISPGRSIGILRVLKAAENFSGRRTKSTSYSSNFQAAVAFPKIQAEAKLALCCKRQNDIFMPSKAKGIFFSHVVKVRGDTSIKKTLGSHYNFKNSNI